MSSNRAKFYAAYNARKVEIDRAITEAFNNPPETVDQIMARLAKRDAN